MDEHWDTFQAYGEFTYVKLAILMKRDKASEYLEKYRASEGDMEWNKIQEKYYLTKFKSAIVDLYMKIQPYLPKIKNKEKYEKLKSISGSNGLSKLAVVELFVLLNDAIYDLGISDLNINTDNPAEAVMN